MQIGEDDYVEGRRSCVAEVAPAASAYDLGKKLHAYRRQRGCAGALVWRVLDRQVNWYGEPRRALSSRSRPPADGILRSEVFRGLWLDAAALVRHDREGRFRRPSSGAWTHPSTPNSWPVWRGVVRPEKMRMIRPHRSRVQSARIHRLRVIPSTRRFRPARVRRPGRSQTGGRSELPEKCQFRSFGPSYPRGPGQPGGVGTGPAYAFPFKHDINRRPQYKRLPPGPPDPLRPPSRSPGEEVDDRLRDRVVRGDELHLERTDREIRQLSPRPAQGRVGFKRPIS